MVETLSISLSGPAFSLLLYENVRSDYNQEGFLLGETIERETNSITDNDEQITKIDRVIKINSAIPCPNVGYFYDATGKMDAKKMGTFLGDEKSKVIAWYKFKRVNAFKLTVREKIIHKNLAKFLKFPENLFTCCLLTSSFDRDAATHLYSQIFVRYNELSFQNLPMHIINLSDTSHTYKNPEPSSEIFNKLFQSLSIDSKRTQSINVITKINTALQKHTDKLVVKLCKAESRMLELEQEIKACKHRISERVNDKVGDSAVPLENGKTIGDNLESSQNSQDGGNKKGSPTMPRGKRGRNTPLKSVNKGENNRVELKGSSRNLRTRQIAQIKNKK